MKIPSFLAPKTHTVEIDGHAFVFSAVTAEFLARLLDEEDEDDPYRGAVEALRPALKKALGSPPDFAPLLRAIADRRQLAAHFVLDALHAADWVERPVTDEAAAAFAAGVDDTMLLTLLAGVVAVNVRAFGPFLSGLRKTVDALNASMRGPVSTATAG